jgi:hypothetical protein
VEGLEEGKGLHFMFVREEGRATAGGLPVRTMLTSMLKRDAFTHGRA